MFRMLKKILRNFFTRPATIKYPKVKYEPCPGARGSIRFDSKKCIYCGLCARRCPTGAIKVDRKNKTLTFEHFKCIICNYCVESCPKKAIERVGQYRAPSYEKTKEVHLKN